MGLTPCLFNEAVSGLYMVIIDVHWVDPGDYVVWGVGLRSLAYWITGSNTAGGMDVVLL